MTSGNDIPNQSNSKFTLQPEEELQFAKFLVNHSLDAAFWLGPDARFLYVNDAACCLLGYSREELLSLTIHAVAPDFPLEVWLEQWRSLKQQGSLTFESRYRTKKGRLFPMEVTFTYVEYNGREFSYAFAREKATDALRTDEAKFRALVETTDAIIFIVRDTQFCYVNPAAEAITGYKKEELLAHLDFRQLSKLKERRRVHTKCGLAFPQHQEIKILTKSGTERWLACSVGVVDFEGKPASLITAIDITNRKLAEVELRQALEQEKEFSFLRACFISMVCHEFRNPLNVVSFSTSLMRRNSHQWTESKKLQYFDYIQTAVEQIRQLLDELLNTGKSEAGKLKFEPRPLALIPFCYDLVAQMQMVNNSSQHTITFASRGNCSTVRVDKKLLQSILTNLLSNAIKYSPAGSTVDLELSCQNGNVIFQIKDAGIGIPAADQQRLFEPFHRGSNVGDVPGTGLGLAVVKKLVDLHGGQIAVTSVVGVGTTFTVTLSIEQPVK